MKKSPVKYASIPYMVFKSIAQREKVVEDIKTKLIEDQNKIDHIQPSLVFYRGDNRNPESIRAAGGFFGRAPITVEHARYIVPFWVSKDMKQRWKVNTGNFGDTPIVATSISGVIKVITTTKLKYQSHKRGKHHNHTTIL